MFKHTWDSNYKGDCRNHHEFMSNKRSEFVGNYGGKWTWYSAHGKNILLPCIDFRYPESWVGEYNQNVNIVRNLITTKPKTLIQIFEETDLTIPEISYCCAWLIKNKEGFNFGVCRSGEAVQIYRI